MDQKKPEIEEVDEREKGGELVPATVQLPVSVETALRQWEEYQELTRRLLSPTDYQPIGNKQFKKKSAWRKYARAFNISTSVSYEDISRDEKGFPLYARIRVQSRASNGRTEEADHECHVGERCCPAAEGQQCDKAAYFGHRCCRAGCNGKIHWSHPGDLPATALTRAKNRAISDLIGAGEVSAEEMDGQRPAASTQPATGAEPQQELPNPLTGRVQEIKQQEGKNKKGAPWTRYGILIEGCDHIFSTFDKAAADAAATAKQGRYDVVIEWEKKKLESGRTVYNILSLIIDAARPDDDEPEPGEEG